MAVHDTACVPALEEGHAGADPYAGPLPAGTEPERGRSRSRVRLAAGWGRGRERLRAFLEIQVRPDEPGAGGLVLSWRPRRHGTPSAGRSAAGGKILELMPAESS